MRYILFTTHLLWVSVVAEKLLRVMQLNRTAVGQNNKSVSGEYFDDNMSSDILKGFSLSKSASLTGLMQDSEY